MSRSFASIGLPRGAVQNPDDVDARLPGAEVVSAVERAVAAGAEAPLVYLGAGGAGIVLRDAGGAREWKASRHLGDHFRTACEREASFLIALGKSPLSKHAPKAVRFHPEQLVTERAAIIGRPAGRWGSREDEKAWNLHVEIDRVMRPRGWTGPERKPDSFVVEEGTEEWILVDGGAAQRLGEAFVTYVEDLIAGRRWWSKAAEPPRDLAFYLRVDRSEAPELRPRIDALLAHLRTLDASIERD